MLTSKYTQYYPASLRVGSGFDIYGEFAGGSVIAQVLDPYKAGEHYEKIEGKTYGLPAYVQWKSSSDVSFIEDVFETRDEFQNKFASAAGLDAQIGAFSGQVNAAFSTEVATSAEHYYCCRNYYQTLGSFDLKLGGDISQVLDSAFLSALSRLPEQVTPDKQFIFDDFFDDFGTHLTSSISIGGNLQYYLSVAKSVSSNKQSIMASMKAEYNSVMYGVSVDAKLENSQEHKAFTSSRHLTLRGAGGDPSLLGRVMGADPSAPDLTIVAALDEWMRTINSKPAEVKFTLIPISKVCGSKENAVAQAFESYKMRKRIEVLVEQLGKGADGEHPKILVGGMPIKAEKKISAGEMGFHVVILNRTQPTEQVGIVLNKVVSDKADKANLGKLYQQLNTILSPETFRTEKHLLILACAGMRTDFAPETDTHLMLLAAGATDDVSTWISLRNDPKVIKKPVSFCHIGIFGTGRRAGMSNFMMHTSGDPWTFRATAYLYGSRGSQSMYSIGAGTKQKASFETE